MMIDQATTPSELEPPLLLHCPGCSKPTDSLKQYRMVDFMLFVGIFAMWRTMVRTECPRCMRRDLLIGTLMNIVPANLLWLPVVLPWHLILVARSLGRGHSRGVLRIVAAEDAFGGAVVAFDSDGRVPCATCGHRSAANRVTCKRCRSPLAPPPPRSLRAG